MGKFGPKSQSFVERPAKKQEMAPSLAQFAEYIQKGSTVRRTKSASNEKLEEFFEEIRTLKIENESLA